MSRRGLFWFLRIGGRLLIIVLLLSTLVSLPLTGSRAAVDLVVLVDDSLSIPRPFTDSAWQEVLHLLGAAPADGRLHLIRFADRPVLETPGGNLEASSVQHLPRSAALDGSTTDIATALREGLYHSSANRPTLMLLLSDGAATQGDTAAALQSVYEAGVPLYLLAPQPGSATESVGLSDLRLPSSVSVGEQVPVQVRVVSASDARVMVSLETDGLVTSRQELKLSPGESQIASFHYEPRAPGINRVTVRVDTAAGGDPAGAPSALHGVVNVLGPAPVLYLSTGSEPAPFADSLHRGGWKVVRMTAAQLMARPSQLLQVGTVVLDDLPIAAMSEHMWQMLVKSVQDDGKGLIVLGGPRSFGAGEYRHSTLEQILPVTAEAAQPQEPAAVLFLLDRSGSMGREQAGASRFSLARQATVAAAQILLPGDHLGVVTFAAEPEVSLSMAAQQSQQVMISGALDVLPGGGTRLGPALQVAAEQLDTTGLEQRLIVLVTDGFSGDEDLQPSIELLRANGVTVIALAVGHDADWNTLQRLTDFNDGRVLPVADVATLPRLMPVAVAGHRAPGVGDPTQVLLVRAPAFARTLSEWPSVSGYMVSKARPEAQVYLQSSTGDPLLATGLAGAGRVAVMPAGLGAWSRHWWQWRDFGSFLGGLTGWAGQGHGSERLALAVADAPGQLVFTVDVLDDGEWASKEKLRLLVDEPSGVRTSPSLVLQAPGRYQAVLEASHTGLYQATLHGADTTLTHALYRNGTGEFHGARSTQESLNSWSNAGWVKPWPGAEAVLEVWPRDDAGWRTLGLVLALLSYLGVLMGERGLAVPLAAWFRAQFARLST